MKKRLIGMATAIVMSFSSFGVTQVLADGPALTYERAEEECDRMNWYFNNGQYLETIAVADDLLQNYTLDDWHTKVVTEYKTSAQAAYNEYLTKPQTNKPELSYEQAEETCNRMIWYYNTGYYLEAIAVADDLLQNYTVDNWHRQVAYDYRSSAQYYYEAYEKKSQRYTYRVPGWGMNITYRGDMSVTNHGKWLDLETPYSGSITLTSFDARDWGDEAPKKCVDHYVYYRGPSLNDGEYGMNFEIISSNYVNVSGFNAYQVVYRNTLYTNRYWTEGEHTLGKMLAFQYGDWIYFFCAKENAYNWSDDFWNAMETVLNGISFS